MRRSAFGLAATVLFVVHAASADPNTDKQLAQSLFDQARELLEKKDYAHACPMFAENQRLDPGGGTLLNLALCHEAEGKLATAHLELGEALSMAARDGRPDREAIAREHLASVSPRVPKLTLVPPKSPPAGLVIELDGVAVSSATLGLSVQVDPGPHEVRAKAPGYVTWTWKEELHERDAKQVELPALIADAGANPPERPAQPPAKTRTTLAIGSWVLGGVAIAALGTSAITGGLALGERGTYEDECVTSRSFCPSQEGIDAADSARTLAWVSTAFLATGIVAAVGAYFWPRKVELLPSQPTASTTFFRTSVSRTPSASAR